MTDERINEKFQLINDRLQIVEEFIRSQNMVKLASLYNDIQNIKLALSELKDVPTRRHNDSQDGDRP